MRIHARDMLFHVIPLRYPLSFARNRSLIVPSAAASSAVINSAHSGVATVALSLPRAATPAGARTTCTRARVADWQGASCVLANSIAAG